MRSNTITCADTDRGDLEARYAAGQLSENEAEVFEEHFFACDRCWTLVQHATEIRAAESIAATLPAVTTPEVVASTAIVPALHVPARKYNNPSRWLALAAVATFIVIGTWRAEVWRRPGAEVATMRGPTDTLHVVTQTRGTTLIASWARTADATAYGVRLYSASGASLFQRETTDTTVALAAASLPNIVPGAALYWEIQAIDRMRQVVGRSGLRKATFPRPGK